MLYYCLIFVFLQTSIQPHMFCLLLLYSAVINHFSTRYLCKSLKYIFQIIFKLLYCYLRLFQIQNMYLKCYNLNFQFGFSIIYFNFPKIFCTSYIECSVYNVSLCFVLQAELVTQNKGGDIMNFLLSSKDINRIIAKDNTQYRGRKGKHN